MAVKQRLSLLLGLAASMFFLWLGFRGLAIGEIVDTLGAINPVWVAIAVPVYFVAIYVLTWRWYYLFRPIKDVSPNRLYPVVLIGYMANNLLPLRLGEIMRTYVLKRREDVPIAPTLTTIFVERVFDGLVMLSFIFAALLFVEFEEPTLQTVIYVTSPLFFGAMAVFFWLAFNPLRALRFYTWLIDRFLPGPLREKAMSIVQDLMAGLVALRSGRSLILVIASSVLSWTLESSTYWIVMQAFDFEVSFFVLLLVVGFGNLSTILPSTAGYIGTFHAVAILTLTTFDVPRVDAGSYAIIMHATLWTPMTVAGFIYLLKLGFGWQDFRRAQDIVEMTDQDTSPKSDAAAWVATESEAMT
jgi:uncharacterized protein (TIRG00374 family)